jgi:hypothetical protein
MAHTGIFNRKHLQIHARLDNPKGGNCGPECEKADPRGTVVTALSVLSVGAA